MYRRATSPAFRYQARRGGETVTTIGKIEVTSNNDERMQSRFQNMGYSYRAATPPQGAVVEKITVAQSVVAASGTAGRPVPSHFFGSNFGRTSWASTSSAPLSRSCRANLPALETNENMLQGQSLTTKRIQHSRRDSWIDASVVSIAHVFRIPMSFNRSIRSMGRFMISMDIEIRKVAVSGPKSGRPACRVFSTCGQSSSINCKQGCGSLH
jgi:hypothetical protein